MPALVLFGIGSGGRRPFPWPIPVILLWPFVGIAFLVATVAGWVAREPAPPLVTLGVLCRAFCQLRGLEVDVRSKKDECVHLRFL
jgi:hypothetical protein